MSSLKRFLPHISLILAFFAITYLYFSPVFQGKAFPQGDTTQWKFSAQEANEYRAEHGKTPFWNSRMFGGMPGYQVTQVEGNNHVKKLVSWIGIPHPANKFFYLMVFSFVMLLAFGINPWLAGIGAVAYAFSSYNLILLEAGHNTKVNAIAFAPIVIAGVALLFRKKYLLGTTLTAIGMALQIGANHIQITYYLGIILGLWFISELIFSIKRNQLKAYFIAAGLALVGAGLGVASNSVNLLLTQEYSEETIRGKSELTITPDGLEKEVSGGLDPDYAFAWSQGLEDVFTFYVPNIAGGGSGTYFGKESETYDALKRQGHPQARQLAQQYPFAYWGSLPFTSGPEYFGAAIIFLFVLGMFTLDARYKWWVLVAFILSFIMSMGDNFSLINDLLFDYLPLYNKFRSVNMAQVIAQMVAPLLAIIGLQSFLKSDKTNTEKRDILLKSLYVAGGFALFVIVLSYMIEPTRPQDDQFQGILDAIIKDRKSLMRKDAFRSLIFVVLSFGALFYYLKDKIKKETVFGVLGILVLVDLWLVDVRYLNHDAFVKPKKVEQTFEPSQVDLQILQDKSNYRVFDGRVNAFNNARASYFHRSVGGYHAAKLRRFQDVVDFHIVNNNNIILDMLNTKYYIQKDKSGKEFVQQNPNAAGNAWFVESINYVEDPDKEILALKDFDPKKEAFVDQRYKPVLDGVPTQTTVDSSASIELTYFSPDTLRYSYNNSKEQLAVFSEIYYNSGKGWQAYLDGKKVDHIRVNYILRGMPLPAGSHDISFIFEPQSYYTGLTLANTSGVIIYLLLVVSIGYHLFQYFKSRNNEPAAD
jgi:hypothetical protein